MTTITLGSELHFSNYKVLSQQNSPGMWQEVGFSKRNEMHHTNRFPFQSSLANSLFHGKPASGAGGKRVRLLGKVAPGFILFPCPCFPSPCPLLLYMLPYISSPRPAFPVHLGVCAQRRLEGQQQDASSREAWQQKQESLALSSFLYPCTSERYIIQKFIAVFLFLFVLLRRLTDRGPASLMHEGDDQPDVLQIWVLPAPQQSKYDFCAFSLLAPLRRTRDGGLSFEP